MSDDGSHSPARHEILPPGRRGARRLAWLYAAAAVILVPWIVYLAETLPRRQYDRHYRAAWVGFDLLLIFAITRTAYMAFRVDHRVQFPATATATLLVRGRLVRHDHLRQPLPVPRGVRSGRPGRDSRRGLLDLRSPSGQPPGVVGGTGRRFGRGHREPGPLPSATTGIDRPHRGVTPAFAGPFHPVTWWPRRCGPARRRSAWAGRPGPPGSRGPARPGWPR